MAVTDIAPDVTRHVSNPFRGLLRRIGARRAKGGAGESETGARGNDWRTVLETMSQMPGHPCCTEYTQYLLDRYRAGE